MSARKLCVSCVTRRDSITCLIEIVFAETAARSNAYRNVFLFVVTFSSPTLSPRDFLYFLQSLLSPHRQLLRDPIEKKLGMGIRPGTNFCQSNEVAQLSRLFPFPLRRNYRLMYNEIHPAAPIKLG